MRPSLFYLLVPIVLLIAVTATGERLINARLAELASATGLYHEAIADTRANIAIELERVTNDKTLATNAEWNLNHSLRATLEAQLRTAKLDEIQLYDAECHELARVALGRLTSFTCPFKSAGEKPVLSWFIAKGENSARLGVTQSFMLGGKSAYLVGLVKLDATWLAAQSSLKQKLTELNLHLAADGPENATIIAKPRHGDSQDQFAVLVSMNFIDRFAAKTLHSGQSLLLPFLWPLVLLGLGLLITFTLLLQAERLRHQNSWQSFYTWLIEAAPPGIREHSSPTVKAFDTNAIRGLILATLERKSETIHTLERKKEALITSLQQRDGEINALKVRLSELAELDSLAIQLERTTATFIKRMEELYQEAEDLASITEEVTLSNSNALANLADDWQQGLAARGTRKFIRSLAETEGATPERSLLDEQLAYLKQTAYQLDDAARDTRVRVTKMRDSVTYLGRIAAYWHGLALGSSRDEATKADLFATLEEAQQLVKLESGLELTSFLNPQPWANEELRPPLPHAILRTALYHIFLALIEQTRSSVSTLIACRLRRDGGQILLAFSIADNNSHDRSHGRSQSPGSFSSRALRPTYHLDLARALVLPFKLTLQALPTRDGIFPIALAWQHTALTHNAAASQLLSTALSNSNDLCESV